MRGGGYVNDIDKLKFLERIALQMTNAGIPDQAARQIAEDVALETLDKMRDMILRAERAYEENQTYSYRQGSKGPG